MSMRTGVRAAVKKLMDEYAGDKWPEFIGGTE
jgi:hypothetical protein